MITLPISKNAVIASITLIVVGLGVFSINVFKGQFFPENVSVSTRVELNKVDTRNFSVEYDKSLWTVELLESRSVKLVHNFENVDMIILSSKKTSAFDIEEQIKSLALIGSNFNLLSNEKISISDYTFDKMMYSISAQKGQEAAKTISYYYVNDDRVFRFVAKGSSMDDRTQNEIEKIISTFDIK